MTTVRISTDGVLRSVYDESVIDAVKAVPGRRWRAAEKVWTIPPNFVTELATELDALGHHVLVDGWPWERPQPKAPPPPPPPPSTRHPFVVLFDYLPARLRQPAWSALARVLHPDTGGDTRAMQELNQHRPGAPR